MPTVIHPMLATSVEDPFNNPDWLFEVKWDGYRAIAFVEGGKLRLESRNQNDLTAAYPELCVIPQQVKATSAILDGEVVAVDESGRASFSLMQQRTGLREGRGRIRRMRDDIPVLYYAFDLLYLNGRDLRGVALETRKQLLQSILDSRDPVRYSDHHVERGKDLFAVAVQHQLEGIVAKRRLSLYQPKRSRDWLKIKTAQRLECVIGGYTDPQGSRQNFGSIVLGLYDDRDQLIHAGHAGSGFTGATHAAMWKRLSALRTSHSPFHGKVESLRNVHWVRPELVAEIKFSEWTHQSEDRLPKLRAPVFLGLRLDKRPEECRLQSAMAETARTKPAL